MTDWVTSERKRQTERQSERQRTRGGDNSLILVKLQFLLAEHTAVSNQQIYPCSHIYVKQAQFILKA